MEEALLVRRLRAGDRAAFDALYRKYRDTALRTASLIVGNQTDGEDVVQDAFVTCFLHIDQLRDDNGFRPWLLRILTRSAWRICRDRRRTRPDEDAVAARTAQASVPSPQALTLAADGRAAVLAAVKGLPLKLRTGVVLHYFNDLSVSEIAQVTGCLSGTVKSRLFTARKRLRQVLDSQEMNCEVELYEQRLI